MFFLPSLPINLRDVSSIVIARIIFLLKDFASPDSNKKPVFSFIIVSFYPPILLAMINFSIDCDSTATRPKVSGSIEGEITISETW